jgi:hypothetical protein
MFRMRNPTSYDSIDGELWEVLVARYQVLGTAEYRVLGCFGGFLQFGYV